MWLAIGMEEGYAMPCSIGLERGTRVAVQESRWMSSEMVGSCRACVGDRMGSALQGRAGTPYPAVASSCMFLTEYKDAKHALFYKKTVDTYSSVNHCINNRRRCYLYRRGWSMARGRMVRD